ncbi:MAG: glycosyltransferase family 4 protein [Anaerolineae bacterium]|jgi:glycosyltransferase involved in cell wall biosynthesis|nr:glycosyltransferase family 4 protein [Anaerolineae bacterium]
MHIVAFSMTPLFATRSMGGAQKQLKKVALHLAEQGHRVTILCTRRDDAREPFRWHPNLEVRPVYRFKQPFPEPYDTLPYHIADAIQMTADWLAQADVFYCHDGGLIFPYIYDSLPAVFSLRSVRFSETLQSGFLFQGDALIVPSQHTAEVWRYTAGRFFPQLGQRLHVIHNGLDWNMYRPTDATALAARLGVDPARHAIVLYPHRPEENKGIRQTIAIADHLVHRHRLTGLRVLVPRWIDTGLSAEVQAFYDGLAQDIAARGLTEHFIFHDWISDDDMPAYYSLGGLTLAVGNYVETFGNTPYESLACGTPVIAARVAAYRDMLPEACLVDYGDVAEAARRAAGLLRDRQRTSPDVLAWLHTHFAQADMVQAYAEVILNAQKLPPLPYRPRPLDATTVYRLAPWCSLTRQGIYHDFRGDYTPEPAAVKLALDYPQGFTLSDGPAGDILRLYQEGYFVPAGPGPQDGV